MSQVGEPMRMDNVQHEFYNDFNIPEHPEAEAVGRIKVVRPDKNRFTEKQNGFISLPRNRT